MNYIRKNGMGSPHIPHNINLYELAQKYKEWANEEGYWVHSMEQYTFATDINISFAYVSANDNIPKQLFKTSSDTVPEAVFKACEWVAKEKGLIDG